MTNSISEVKTNVQVVQTNDKNNDKKVQSSEAQPLPLVESKKEESWLGGKLRSFGFNETADWWEDKDKVSTDGKDDGEISTTEKVKSFAKGFFGGIVKSIAEHPIETAATIGVVAAVEVISGGFATPFIAAGFGAIGLYNIGKGIYDANQAKTDGETKQAYEQMGEGAFMVAGAATAAKSVKSFSGKAKIADVAAEAPKTSKTKSMTSRSGVELNERQFTTKNGDNLYASSQTKTTGGTTRTITEIKNEKGEVVSSLNKTIKRSSSENSSSTSVDRTKTIANSAGKDHQVQTHRAKVENTDPKTGEKKRSYRRQ